MARKNSKKPMNIDEISYDYGVEEDSFDEVIVGTPVASFCFGSKTEDEIIQESTGFITSTAPNPVNKTQPQLLQVSSQAEAPRKDKTTSKLLDNRVGKPTPNGITPPIDGETFDVKRTYALRKSTIRKLNELKAAHPDVNVYLSTILDAAITHYYNFILKGDGSTQQ
jgi:hypothetical protein